MKSDVRALGILAACFVAAYAAAFEATNWIAVYGLDWWDGKFGDRAGNVRFNHELLPYFAAVALLSHASASLSLRARLRGAPAGRLAGAGAGAALLAEGGWFAFAAATRHLAPGGAADALARAVSLALLALGPALATALAARLAVVRRPSRGESNAPAV